MLIDKPSQKHSNQCKLRKQVDKLFHHIIKCLYFVCFLRKLFLLQFMFKYLIKNMNSNQTSFLLMLSLTFRYGLCNVHNVTLTLLTIIIISLNLKTIMKVVSITLTPNWFGLMFAGLDVRRFYLLLSSIALRTWVLSTLCLYLRWAQQEKTRKGISCNMWSLSINSLAVQKENLTVKWNNVIFIFIEIGNVKNPDLNAITKCNHIQSSVPSCVTMYVRYIIVLIQMCLQSWFKIVMLFSK